MTVTPPDACLNRRTPGPLGVPGLLGVPGP